MSLVQDALKITRTLLNDDAGQKWPDSILMPKIVVSHLELVNKLVLNGVPVIWTTQTLQTVTAGSLILPAQPTNLARPIKMDERTPGDVNTNAVPMTKVDFIPNLDQTDFLRYWAWIGQVITFLGSTQTRQVTLYYDETVPPPLTVNDSLFFTQSETFLGPRTAALVMIDSPQYGVLNQIAEANLSSIVRREVKAGQNLPVRRRPFRYAVRYRAGIYSI